MVRSFVGRTKFFFFCYIKDTVMYSSAQASSFVAPDDSLLPAMAKRTATEASEATVVEFPVTALEEFDPELFEVKVRGKTKDGFAVVATAYNNKRLTLNLTTGKKWAQVKYRVSPYDDSDFKTMKVTLVVDNAVASVIDGIEEEVKKSILGQHANCTWHSSMHEGLFSAKIVLEDKDPAKLTQCRVRPFQKDVVVASGKDQVLPLIDGNGQLIRSKAKLAVTLQSVWIMKEKTGALKAGVNWRIVNFMVDVPEKICHVFPDVFENVSWDDEE